MLLSHPEILKSQKRCMRTGPRESRLLKISKKCYLTPSELNTLKFKIFKLKFQVKTGPISLIFDY